MANRVLSCIQPTGNLHLGRYFGALRNWVELQENYNCVYGIVDYHAMTMPFNPKKLREQTWNLVFDMLAIGIRPGNIFVQSMIPEHAELAWIFNCVTSFGELGRMVQFKDKSQQVNEASRDAFVSAGLFTYPVLQAADILIYRADFVPVGNDQDQHLELTRNIAQRFNHVVGKEYFVLPETLHSTTPRVMSTADPSIKMSASKGEKHNIGVFSDPARILKQIRSAVTDTQAGGDEMSPGVNNLFSILNATGLYTNEYERLVKEHSAGSLKYAELKDVVGAAVVELVTPFRENRIQLVADKKSVKEQIRESSAEIRKMAIQTLHEVKDLVGLMNP